MLSAETIDMFATEGETRKEQALTDHEDHKSAAINWLREKLRSLYNERKFGYDSTPEWYRMQGLVPVQHRKAFVNADDARRIYERSTFPPEYSQNRTFFGSIFRGKNWQPVGLRVKSLHPANNARKIDCWMYVK